MQKQKGKLVFSTSGVFHKWHIVSSVAQRQPVTVVNFHKKVQVGKDQEKDNLSLVRQKYEILR